jgi:putative NADH-flavin reductase
MRILVAGASGVVGRATLPHLTRHDVAGLTRSPEKLGSLRDLGAEPILCDVYDHERLLRMTQRFRPRIVVNFLTDLSAGSVQANDRIRREGGANLLNAARATAARRLVVERVAVILRFGRFWGPGTDYRTPPQPPTIHIDTAGAKAAPLLMHAPPGTYLATETNDPG